MTDDAKNNFLEVLWDFYTRHGRDMPWRHPEPDGSFNPYKIMVSELMLQQTQVSRVVPKYESFLRRFPTVQRLASAELGDVLREWQGLGYNRRAKFLWQAAGELAELGVFPAERAELVQLPGIGPNTAGAILAYAYNQPVGFIETNIRTVYIHHFLRNRSGVSDSEILDILDQTIDREQPREFYWALMDYGSHLKATVGNASRESKHYTKQSAFNGSKRQVRGEVIRALGEGTKSFDVLQGIITDKRLPAVLDELVAEGLVRVEDGVYSL